MEAKIYCAYNVFRDRYLSPKVTVVDRPDQPLTILRLLVEGLGLKADTSLWLTPLHSTPQLVRPFPFDLVYLDKDHRVIRGVELLPEVPLPTMESDVASALVLPVHTLSATGTKEGDQLVVCVADQLEQRLGEIVREVSPHGSTRLKADESAGDLQVPIPLKEKSEPVLAASRPVFVPVTARAVPQDAGFTVALSTSWQITNSTMAVAPGGIELVERKAAAEESPLIAETASEAETTSLEERESESAATIEDCSAAENEAAPAELIENPLAISIEDASVGAPENATATEAQRQTHAMTEPLPDEKMNGAEVQEEEPSIAIAPFLDEADRAAVLTQIGAVASIAVSTETSNAVLPEVADEVSVEVPAKPEVPVSEDASAAQKNAFDEAGKDLSTASEGRQTLPQAKSAGTYEPEISQAPRRKIVEAQAGPAIQAKKAVTQKKTPRAKKPGEENEEKKDHLGIRVIRWLNLDDPLPDRRGKKRYLMPGLFAYDAAAKEPKPCEVRDVSPTGLYLKTPKRWKPGQIISLTLRCNDAKEMTSASSVRVRVRTVRSDKEGTVVSFVFPKHVEFEPWNRLHTRKTTETDAEFYVRELRLARAFGFLRRICESATEQIRLGLHERFSNKRLASAVEIALRAEDMLPRRESAGSMSAHPHVLMRILEEGSWAEDELVRQMWAGLLVTSCTDDGQDTSNMVFIDLLDKLTPLHLRVLAFVCRKGEEVVLSGESLSSLTLYCSGDELVKVAGSNNLARIQQTIGHLSNYGLLAESARPSYVGAMEKIKTKATPTALGLKLHARCSGQRD